ncbi:hypothetical protein A9Q98_09995 [Thalassotalea sp. 42_200_T64]|nr:hypothetical protein A9Q98_09995 [Thalassotalea sp. 42_200_T64]
MQDILNYFLDLPFWELLAVSLSIAYVVLVARNNTWCWPAAFFSTMIFTVIFHDVSLLMEALLNVYYMAMAVYGWYRWQNSNLLTANTPLPVCTWPLKNHFRFVVSLSVISLSMGWFMDNYTDADYAYLDTFTTVFAIATTYLVTIKLLENWLYWFVINSVSVFIFLQKGLEPTAVLFAFNILMCIIGYVNWNKLHHSQQNEQELSVASTR